MISISPSSFRVTFVLSGALVALALGQAPVADSTRSLTAEDVAARAREALGWSQLSESGGAVRWRGDEHRLGVDATQVLLFDAHGRFVRTSDGPLPQREGFDGRIGWTRDWTDTPRELVLGDLAEARIGELLSTGCWTTASDCLQFELGPSASEDEIVLEFQYADGVQRGAIVIDAKSWLPRSATHGPDGRKTRWSFDEYEAHGELRLPSRIEFAADNMTSRIELRSVERLAAIESAAFTPQLAAPKDTRFVADVASKLEVKRVRTGHLLVHPLLDGRDLGWFIFDSGAGTNCISTAVVEGLQGPFGEISARGIGGHVAAHFWRATELSLGPIVVDSPVFMELDLAFLEKPFGVPIGGILGYELLARCVAEVDMQRGEVALFEPGKFTLPTGGQWSPAVLYGRHPCVRASVEGQEGTFRLDTGAAGDTVSMHVATVRALGLLEGRETKASLAGGVGGNVATRSGTLSSFVLGGRTFRDLAAEFSTEEKGAFDDPYTWGNIGGKLLEPFRLVFDYPATRVGFVERAEND